MRARVAGVVLLYCSERTDLDRILTVNRLFLDGPDHGFDGYGSLPHRATTVQRRCRTVHLDELHEVGPRATAQVRR